jgi:hypothetical protein
LLKLYRERDAAFSCIILEVKICVLELKASTGLASAGKLIDSLVIKSGF